MKSKLIFSIALAFLLIVIMANGAMASTWTLITSLDTSTHTTTSSSYQLGTSITLNGAYLVNTTWWSQGGGPPNTNTYSYANITLSNGTSIIGPENLPGNYGTMTLWSYTNPLPQSPVNKVAIYYKADNSATVTEKNMTANYYNSTLFLNAPVSGSFPSSNIVTTNASANVVGGATLTNMTLYDNSTGTWGARNTSISNAQVISDSGKSGFAYYGATSNRFGDRILTKNKIKIYSANLDTSAGATNCFIYNSTANGLIDSGIIIDSTCVFTNTPTLNASTYYYILVNSTGSLSMYRASATYPISNTYLNWTNGWDGGSNDGYVYQINKLNVSLAFDGQVNSSTQTFTNTYSSGSNILWNVKACDSDGACGFAPSNYTFSVDSVAPTITINYPTSIVNYGRLGGTLQLNYTATDSNLDKCWYNYNGTNSSATACSTGVVNLANITLTSQKNVTFYANDTAGNLGSSVKTWDYNVFENSRTYDASVYETQSETYILNVTSAHPVLSGTFYLNGLGYSSNVISSGGNYILTNSIDIPVGAGTNYPYWNVTTSDGTFSTDNLTQTVSTINFSLCSSAPQNIPYLNLSFESEATGNPHINGSLSGTFNYWLGSGTQTKSYSYLSTTDLFNYTFCFTPSNKSIFLNESLSYYNSTCPTRNLVSSAILTNTTTQSILYLLSSTSGIYVTFQIINAGGSPLSGVDVEATRNLSGTIFVAGSGITDSAGAVTFFLNPSFSHTITASKAGFGTLILSITPTQSTYTLVMGSGSNIIAYVSSIPGVYWTRGPAVGLLEPGVTNFDFNVSSLLQNIVKCKIELQNGSRSTLATQEATASSNSSCYVTNPYSVVFGDTIYGLYYVDLGDGKGYQLLENDGQWYTLYNSSEVSPFSLKNIFEYLNDKTVWGGTGSGEDEKKFEFSKFVIIFLVLAIFAAAANIGTQFDISMPGTLLIGLPLMIWFLSIAGWVTGGNGFFYIQGATPFAFLDNIVIALYSTAISFAMALRIFRGVPT